MWVPMQGDSTPGLVKSFLLLPMRVGGRVDTALEWAPSAKSGSLDLCIGG
jgi:hypothetical protein